MPAGKTLSISIAVLVAVSQLISTGLTQYEKGEYDEAVKTFTKVIVRYPATQMTDDAYYWRAMSYLKLGKESQARSDLFMLLRKFSDSEYVMPAEAELVKHFRDRLKVEGKLDDIIKRQIERLADDDFKVRELASACLTELGDVALPLVRKAADSEDPEVKLRARKILADIKDRQALARLQSPESYITLKVKDRPLSEVLDEIEKQTGNALEVTDANILGRTVTCDFNAVTFWQALDSLCLQAGMYHQTSSQVRRAVRLYSGTSRKDYPRAYCGPCMLYVTNLSKSYNFSSKSSYLNLNGELWVEPGLECTRYNLRFTRAVDNQGTSLKASGSSNSNLSNGSQGSWGLSVSKIERETSEIALMEGSVDLEIPVAFSTLEVKDIEKAQNASTAGDNYAMTVKSATREGTQLKLDLSVAKTYQPTDSRRYEYYQGKEFSLVDAKGKEIQPSRTSHRSGNSNGLTYTWGGDVYFTLPADFKPAAFKFNYVSRTVRKTVPLRIEHVPVP